jgi:hypothetical protein
MKTSTVLWAAAIGGVGYYLYKTYMVTTGLQFVPQGVDFGSGSVTVGVQNPTSTALTLLSFTGTVYNGSTPVANVSNFTQTIIQPNQSTTLKFNVAPNVFGIASSLFTGATDDLVGPLKLTGTANVGGVSIPITINW